MLTRSKIAGRKLATAAAAAGLLAAAGAAAAPTKIGMITTLSGGGAALGQDIKDGFALAIAQGEGSLGGQPVELLVTDDQRDKAKARQAAQSYLDDDVAVLTGLVWSSLALALVPDIVASGAFYISPNAGPSELAGQGCHANYFNVAWQNDNLHEAVGQYLNQEGYDEVVLLAPDYAAGYDGLKGFKRYYAGTVLAERYAALGAAQHHSAIAAIRDAEPDAVYFFYPGRMGITFTSAFHGAGLGAMTDLFAPGFSHDQRSLQYLGRNEVGSVNSAQWSPDLANAANKQFVAAFEEAYGRTPSLYASQGYDAARLIGSALAATDGAVAADPGAFRQALRAADFDSVRGDFRFNSNQHPIQDIYMRRVVRTADGLTNEVIATAFDDHRDAYAEACPL